MRVAEDLRDYLTTGGVTARIFVGEAPESPASTLAIIQTAGLGPTRTMSGTPGDAPVEHVRCQVRARAADYTTCSDLMQSAYHLLSGMPERILNNRRYHYVTPIQTPYYLGLDGAARPVIAANFDVYRAEST